MTDPAEQPFEATPASGTTAGRAARRDLGRPYCDACGYALDGLTESARCPECGGALVDVLMREPLVNRQYRRYTSPRRFMGMPLLQIATGAGKGDRLGRAVGVIAIGNYARGVIAMGNVCVGLVAFGNLSIGVVSFGSLAVGGIALGGMAIGGVTLGGLVFYLYKGLGGLAMPVWPW